MYDISIDGVKTVTKASILLLIIYWGIKYGEIPIDMLQRSKRGSKDHLKFLDGLDEINLEDFTIKI